MKRKYASSRPLRMTSFDPKATWEETNPWPVSRQIQILIQNLIQNATWEETNTDTIFNTWYIPQQYFVKMQTWRFRFPHGTWMKRLRCWDFSIHTEHCVTIYIESKSPKNIQTWLWAYGHYWPRQVFWNFEHLCNLIYKYRKDVKAHWKKWNPWPSSQSLPVYV